MNFDHPNNKPPARLVFWIIWAAILMGLFILQKVAPRQLPDTDGVTTAALSTLSLVGIGMATVSMIIRWLVIPRLQGPAQQFPAMIVGLALAEAPGILGMFVVPAQNVTERTILLSTAIACVIVSAPIYAKSSADNQAPPQEP